MVKLLHTFILGFIFMNGFAQQPVMNPIVGSSAVCATSASQNTYSTSASNNPTSFVWGVIPANGVAISNGSTSMASFSFPNVNATYTIYCSASNSFGTSSNEFFVVTAFEMPNVSFSGANTFCQGSSTSISASSTLMSASSTVSYSWAPSSGLNTTSGSNVIANPSAPTNYTVTAINGVCSNTAQINVTPFEMLTVSFSGANTFCQGSSTSISASSTVFQASSTISYNWVPATGLNTTTGSSIFAGPANATTYTVTAHYGNCTNTGTVTVTPITLSVSVSGANTFCQGQSTILSASATVSQGNSTMSYNWSPPVGLNSITGSSVTAGPPASTNYTVTATNGVCSNKSSITVTPFEQVPVTISGANTFCQGSSTNLTASSTASPTNSISYSWLPATGLNTSSGNSVAANPSTATNYTVTSTNGVCSSTQTITITPFQDIPVTISGSATFCEGFSTSLTASAAVSPTTAVSYSWLPTTDLNTATGANVNANPANATTYTVTAYFGACTNTAQITVSQLNAPIITAVASRTAVCYGDTTTFNAYGATTYTWNNGAQNGVSHNVWGTSNYIVTGTGPNGCTGTATVNIIVDNIAAFGINSSNPFIIPGSGGSATLTINGTAGTTYSLNGVATPTTVVVSPTVTTTYTFTSGNPNGCHYTYEYTQYVGYSVGVKSLDPVNENYFKAFPNPNNGAFKLRSGTKETITIVNAIGEIVMTLELEPDTDHEITGLSSGIYVISTGKTKVKIIVTQ